MFIIIIICMNIFLSIFVIECFIMPNRIFFYIMNIHIYNLFYICTLACIMSFVPENKLIPIRILMITRWHYFFPFVFN